MEKEGFLESCSAVFLAGLNGAVDGFTLERVIVSTAETKSIDEEFEDVVLAAVVQPSSSVEFVEWFVNGCGEVFGDCWGRGRW
jgi:hypothetical protein